MPITLHTGLPGGGKTLYTIDHVRALAAVGSRPVYYLGIPDLALDWNELEPADLDKLEQLPAGSIIVVDECQRHYPPRMSGARVSPKLSYFETHRHHGHDIFLITQNPRLIDVHVRKLIETHRHLIRHWGKEKARVWEWQECNENPSQKRDRSHGQYRMWKYPKDVYALYKSTTQDTIQARFPWGALLLPLAIGVISISAMAYWATNHAPGISDGDAAVSDDAGAPVGSGSLAGGSSGASTVPIDPRSVAMMHSPVLRGVPGTAPMYYDKYLEVRDYPRLTGCVTTSIRCRCYTQQGTRVDIAPEQCHQIALRGPSFDHSRADPRGVRGDGRGDDDRLRESPEERLARDVENHNLANDVEYTGSVAGLVQRQRN